MEEEEKTERKMTPIEFWIRFALWISFSLLAPIVYIFVAYGIFKEVTPTGTKMSGWGIIAILFTCVVLASIINQAKKGLSYGNIIRQCLDGFGVLVWLLGAIILVHNIKNNMDSFETFLIVVFICEAIAVPVNPMRKWAEQNNIERAESLFTRVANKIIGKKGE